mmetsp:Transcript_66921/g.216308  ORF Transcript_66921/g.216308 Transcript_66921/m.216308 type:complete len:259 (-) Transcript_66921:280-1056(-)
MRQHRPVAVHAGSRRVELRGPHRHLVVPMHPPTIHIRVAIPQVECRVDSRRALPRAIAHGGRLGGGGGVGRGGRDLACGCRRGDVGQGGRTLARGCSLIGSGDLGRGGSAALSRGCSLVGGGGFGRGGRALARGRRLAGGGGVGQGSRDLESGRRLAGGGGVGRCGPAALARCGPAALARGGRLAGRGGVGGGGRALARGCRLAGRGGGGVGRGSARPQMVAPADQLRPGLLANVRTPRRRRLHGLGRLTFWRALVKR